MQRTTKRRTSKRKKPASHVNHAKRVSLANLVRSVKIAPHVMHLAKKQHKLYRQPKLLFALACHACKRSACLWPTCKLWRKAAA